MAAAATAPAAEDLVDGHQEEEELDEMEVEYIEVTRSRFPQTLGQEPSVGSPGT